MASARNAGAPPLSQGFAYKWCILIVEPVGVDLSLSGAAEDRWTQDLCGGLRPKTWISSIARELQYQGKSIPILYQGIAWVDAIGFANRSFTDGPSGTAGGSSSAKTDRRDSFRGRANRGEYLSSVATARGSSHIGHRWSDVWGNVMFIQATAPT